ncbi:MAG: hypothetical protein ACI9JR_002683, partial [Gammaproteobacteria bacterium]
FVEKLRINVSSEYSSLRVKPPLLPFKLNLWLFTRLLLGL